MLDFSLVSFFPAGDIKAFFFLIDYIEDYKSHAKQDHGGFAVYQRVSKLLFEFFFFSALSGIEGQQRELRRIQGSEKLLKGE